MASERVRISLSDLPSRPRDLDDSALSLVFGGCSEKLCSENSHCCFRICYKNPGERIGVCRRNA